ncbi:Cyclic nucleotide-gated potassium channel [Pirellulimonas nuda]|uniref:Cyclic nucleotide-gated potassium channel n=1 Tax=Pirellulimonas nuda TaxID=2528009 RepID=A0A518DHQ8_9BACT|nr:ion transporter [Pirellulimonas nuda]QDU91021.1 Cyclic nucleotide-gated potassium channel [Pirellulimonas nuda]
MTTPQTRTPPPAAIRPGPAPWQRRFYEVIFEADTPAGKTFDVALLALILLSVAVVMLESVDNATLGEMHPRLRAWLRGIEWGITVLFTLEYLARIACVARPSRYVLSFFGLVDLLAVLPTYLGLFVSGTHVLATVRTLRLLRVFRVFKMGQHVSEANALLKALRRTWPKITVFLSVIFCAIVILGTVMYLIERDHGSGFDSIPRSVYWAIVTMTTVGYGDIAPRTIAGQSLAAVIMLFGYAIIIVPTGLFSAEVMNYARPPAGPPPGARTCPRCDAARHDAEARYCNRCGERLGEPAAD